jgi:hypothetical protein
MDELRPEMQCVQKCAIMSEHYVPLLAMSAMREGLILRYL